MLETVVSELSAALAAIRKGDLNTAGAIAQRLLQNNSTIPPFISSSPRWPYDGEK